MHGSVSDVAAHLGHGVEKYCVHLQHPVWQIAMVRRPVHPGLRRGVVALPGREHHGRTSRAVWIIGVRRRSPRMPCRSASTTLRRPLRVEPPPAVVRSRHACPKQRSAAAAGYGSRPATNPRRIVRRAACHQQAGRPGRSSRHSQQPRAVSLDGSAARRCPSNTGRHQHATPHPKQ